jgi:hypothetical protein
VTDTTNNLALWDSVSRVPKEHLKAFDRGNFKGTAIKPAWAYKAMTEALGPVGKGWSISEPQFTIVDGVKNEKLVYCVVSVLVTGGQSVGVGGDKIVKHIAASEKYNRPERWENDDEAFKKAYTDALTNALVKLGVGADIHMGLWDGNKYVDEAANAPSQDTKRTGNPLDKPVTKEETRALKDELCREIEAHTSAMKLRDWAKVPENRSRKASLHPDFQDVVGQSWLDKLSELEGRAAA